MKSRVIYEDCCRCWFDLVIVSLSVFDTLFVLAGGTGRCLTCSPLD